MKRQVLLRTCLLAMAGMATLAVAAAEEERMFLLALLASGQEESVMLGSGGEAAESVVLHHKEGIVVVDGSSYQLSDVAGLRFEKRMVDGIENSEFKISNSDEVYDLQGRRVGRNSEFGIQNYKKGIYIINGRKVVVK